MPPIVEKRVHRLSKSGGGLQCIPKYVRGYFLLVRPSTGGGDGAYQVADETTFRGQRRDSDALGGRMKI